MTQWSMVQGVQYVENAGGGNNDDDDDYFLDAIHFTRRIILRARLGKAVYAIQVN